MVVHPFAKNTKRVGHPLSMCELESRLEGSVSSSKSTAVVRAGGSFKPYFGLSGDVGTETEPGRLRETSMGKYIPGGDEDSAVNGFADLDITIN